MKNRYIITGFMALLTMSFIGCGGGTAGAPGTSGGGDTGILIQSVSITTTTPDLDVAPDNTVTPPKPIHRDDATITIVDAKLTDNLVSDPFPATVDQCTITYLKANEDPSAPIIPSLTVYPNCTILAGSNTCVTTLIDIQRKEDYWTAINNGLHEPAEYPTHYVAQYNCQYVGNFGKTGYFAVDLDIYLADFAQ